jgi:dihydroorotase
LSPPDPARHDLAITGGRVLDPVGGLDQQATLTIADGRIAAVTEPHTNIAAAQTIDATGLLVVPGLIDLHTHVYPGVSHYGIDVDELCLGRGVTTAVDAGSAGAQTFPGLRRHVIDAAATRVRAYVHVSVAGMISARVGELEDLRWASPEDAAASAREHDDVVVGIKVRLGYQMVGRDAEPALQLARQAADLLGGPLMVHVIDMPMPITRLLPKMGEGDVITHCFHGSDGGVLDEDGRVFPQVHDAVRRGVILDIGHGIGSFDFDVASAALAQDLRPTTISSDVHAHNVEGPAYDLPTTMSKLLHLGIELEDVIRASTSSVARVLDAASTLGSLTPGREADVTLLEVRDGAWRLTDGAGKRRVSQRLIVPRWVVRAGVAQELDSPVPARIEAAQA